jgi:superfamily II DNA or RNA helicase
MTLTIGGRDNLIEPDLMKILEKYFSINVPGSYWMRKTRKGWDGKAHFLTEKGKIMTGFLPLLLRFLDEEYPLLSVEIIDDRGDIPLFNEEFATRVGKKDMSGRYEHQAELVKLCNNWIDFRGQSIYFPRGVIDAATNAGKTTMYAGIINNLSNPSTLLLIHRKMVFHQLVKEFDDYIPGIGTISDKGINIGGILTIGMIKTIHDRLDNPIVSEYLENCKVLIVDECHAAGSATYVKVLAQVQAGVRIFMSGTALDSDDVLSRFNILKMSGEKLGQITKKELMDKRISKEVVAHIYLNRPVLKVPVITYDEHIQHLIHYSESRAMVMYEMIKGIKDPHILISVDLIDHALFLRDFLVRNRLFESWDVGVVHGKSPNSRTILQGFTRGDFPILISTSILQEGINIPLVNGLIYAVGKHSKIKIKQWMGRAERLGQDAVAIFMDFYDLGKYVEKDSKKRLAIYNELGIKVEWKFDRKSLKKLYR